MKRLKDEEGSSLVYLLWIFTATIVLFLIITNIARVFIVKQQASAAAELAALAATGDVLVVTEEAIKDFDIRMAIWAAENNMNYEPLWKEIEIAVNQLVESGKSKQQAYINVFNDKLPGVLNDPIPGRPNLKSIIKSNLDTDLQTNMVDTVRSIIRENEANDGTGHVEILISKEKNRVEVKTDATYKTLTDDSLLASFSEDIPQKGYGPPLTYLKKIDFTFHYRPFHTD